MSDSPNIIISEMTAEKLRKELVDIRNWYSTYDGEKEIKLVKAGSGQFGYPDVLEWTTVEELEEILDGGTFEEWQKQFLHLGYDALGVDEYKKESDEYCKALPDKSGLTEEALNEDYKRLKFTKKTRKESGVRFGAYQVEEDTPEQRKAYLSTKNKAKNRKKNKASRANRRKNK
jgi:hypothetical protein